MSKASRTKQPALSPWSGNRHGGGRPPVTPRLQPNGYGPALSWGRTLIGLVLASIPVLAWPMLFFLWATLISLDPAALPIAMFLGFLGTVFFRWLLLPFVLTQTAAIGLFVAVTRALRLRMFWWQPMVIATAALIAHKMWFWDYTRWDNAIEVSLIAGVPAGLLFWGSAAGWVWSAKGPQLATDDQTGDTP